MGNVLGGFTSVAWTSSGSWQPVPSAFLFYKGSGSTAIQRYSQKGTSPQFAVHHGGTCGPMFGGGHDLIISPSVAGARGITYCSKALTYDPMPINGTTGILIDLIAWQVPPTGGSAPPSTHADATVSDRPACRLSYSSNSTPPVELCADMSRLAGPATALTFDFGLWLKEELDKYDRELQALRRRAKLFEAEKAFMQLLLVTKDVDGSKEAWLQKVILS
eukprot:TRINITY_DN5000_c0_g1_i2.p1 TRINITY_DN5000_c0_g1~~TRINITY_DN5000_c0_g1_i2.p1  ORF type:complete len:219 (-),score=42.69 TRINITY_DN5000_c0_g1_i2:535-1191(-)